MWKNPFGHLFAIHTGFRGALPQATVLALLCASLTTFADTAIAQAPVFLPTGSMTIVHRFPTATLLDSGKVLVAGGWDTNANLSLPKMLSGANAF